MVIKDGDWRLFDHDFKLGRTVWHYFDGIQDHWRIDYQVDDVLKANQEDRADHQGARWGDGRRVASIPLNVYHEQLAEAQNQKDEKYLSKWLNDPDNAKFRTFEGNL